MSAVEICNDALALIGKGEISSLDSPEPAARQCNRAYTRTYREMQARFDWEHTLKVVDLSRDTAGSVMPGYLYAHKLPDDYARFSALHAVEDADDTMLDANFSPVESGTTDTSVLRSKFRADPVPFKVAKNRIHTNFTPIRLVYHRFDESTVGLPELYRAALAAQLAAKIVFPLTRDTKVTADTRELANAALSLAQDEEDNDELTEAPEGSSFQDARR